MDERDYALLDILGQTGNITRAADRLFITQSALSKRIQGIERELDVQLLLRSRQGVRFTPEGEIVLNACHDEVNSLRQMRQALGGTKGKVFGTLNAGISLNYALYCLPDFLVKFRDSYPDVELNITTGQSRRLIAMLQSGSIDLAILRGEHIWEGERTLLRRENICLIAPREVSDEELVRMPYISRRTDADFERTLTSWMHEKGIRPQSGGVHVDNIRTCVEMVTRELGWSIVPEICLGGFTGYIRPIRFADGTSFIRSTYLMYNDSLLALPQARAFVDLLKSEAGTHCGTDTEKGKTQ